MDAIYILDRVQLRPGQLQAYQQALRERYLPGARERGMELVGSWITPPLEIDEGNELVTLWSLPSTEAFWAMRAAASASPELAAWWEESDQLTLSRERKIMTPAEIS
jgi:hypothetical protein